MFIYGEVLFHNSLCVPQESCMCSLRRMQRMCHLRSRKRTSWPSPTTPTWTLMSSPMSTANGPWTKFRYLITIITTSFYVCILCMYFSLLTFNLTFFLKFFGLTTEMVQFSVSPIYFINTICPVVNFWTCDVAITNIAIPVFPIVATDYVEPLLFYY